MTRLTLEETMDIVHERVARKFSNVSNKANLDDLIQEARISVWKDYEDGKEFKHIWIRAKYRVMGLLRVDKPPKLDRSGAHPQQWTGHLLAGRDHQNAKKGQITREKINQYLKEYRSLHGHNPTHAEIASAVGLSRPSVTYQMDRLYLFSGPVIEEIDSLDFMLEFHFDQIGELDVPMDWSDVIRLLKTHVPDERERYLIFRHVFEDKTYGELGKEFGITGHRAGQLIQQGLTRLREVLKT